MLDLRMLCPADVCLAAVTHATHIVDVSEIVWMILLA